MKYDYSDFFVNLTLFILGGLLVDLMYYYIFHFEAYIIIEDLWPMIIRCAGLAAIANLFTNLKRVYNLLEGIHEKVKKDIDKKLVKVKPKYRQVPLNKDVEQEGLTT